MPGYLSQIRARPLKLATQMETNADALRNGLEWVWAKPTGTRTIFF